MHSNCFCFLLLFTTYSPVSHHLKCALFISALMFRIGSMLCKKRGPRVDEKSEWLK